MQDKAIYAQLAEKLEIAGWKSEMVPRILEKLLNEAEARWVNAPFVDRHRSGRFRCTGIRNYFMARPFSNTSDSGMGC
jgi:hypothetical protein